MKKKEKRAQLIFFLKRVHFFITYLLKEAKEICKKIIQETRILIKSSFTFL